MEDLIEKLMLEGKALKGYDEEDVKEEILNLQTSYTEKKNRLLQQLELVRAENKEFKDKLIILKESPPKSHLMEEISSMFMTVFLEDTLAVKKLKEEIEKQEKPYYETIKLRRQQKEQAKRRVSEATEYLKSLQENFSFIQKEKEW
jgi:hypothetical protein